jgi:hypothetical protein
MAVGAIDVEIGPCPGVERLRRITPIGIARHLGQRRQPCQVADLLQKLKLIFRSGWVAVVAIEMAGFEPNRGDALGLQIRDVASCTLILIRHDVGERFARPVGRDEFKRHLIARAGELRIGLLGIPYIGQRLPAVLAPHEEPSLDEPYALEIKSQAGKVS